VEDGAEFSGKTVEEAIVQAETQLGTPRQDLEITIITAGRSGVFGIGAEPARVRAQLRQPVAATVGEPLTEPVADVAPPRSALADDFPPDETEDEEEFGAEESAPRSRPVRSATSEDLPNEAAEVLRNLLNAMGFDAEVTVRSTENPVMLAITGDNLGVLIGRRGDNLSALQFMVNLILSKHRRQWPRVVVDVENYRARREDSLRSLADRIAYRVRRNQRPFTLEAMPAGDRRVIHLTLRDAADVETYSIGEGVARRVVIAPKRTSQPATGNRY
jgi:spoIIIJ-associated protein